MPLAELTAFISSVKASLELAKAVKSITDKAEIDNKLSEIRDSLFTVQERALALQSVHQDLIQEKGRLLQEIAKFNDWQKTEAEYELHEPDPGVFVYAYKKVKNPSKPEHWLCPNCWAKKTKSILQRQYHRRQGAKYNCLNCEASISWWHDDPKEPSEVLW